MQKYSITGALAPSFPNLKEETERLVVAFDRFWRDNCIEGPAYFALQHKPVEMLHAL